MKSAPDACQNTQTFAARGGGFVFSQVHNIQPNVPVANVLTMLAAAREMGETLPESQT